MEMDLYQILSVEPTAPQAEVNEAARRLTTAWNKGTNGIPSKKRLELLSQIRRASATLTDPEKRFEYDMQYGHWSKSTSHNERRRKGPVPIKDSESLEKLMTVKIPGEYDSEKVERLIASYSTLPHKLLMHSDTDITNKIPRSASYGNVERKKVPKDLKSTKYVEKGSFNKKDVYSDALSVKLSGEKKTPSTCLHSSNDNKSADISESSNLGSVNETGVPVGMAISAPNKLVDTTDTLKDFEKTKPKEELKEDISVVNAEEEISENHPEQISTAHSQNAKQILGQDISKTSTKETENFSESNQYLPNLQRSQEMNGTDEAKSVDYEPDDKPPITRYSFKEKDSMWDKNSNETDNTDVERRVTAGTISEVCSPDLLPDESGQLKDGEMNPMSDKQLKQQKLNTEERTSEIQPLYRSPSERKYIVDQRSGISGNSAEEISVLSITENLKEPIYLVDEEKMNISLIKSENSNPKTGNEFFVTESPSKSSANEKYDKHSSTMKNPDDETQVDNAVRKISSLRYFMLNVLGASKSLKDEPISSFETEMSKKKSPAIKRISSKPRSDDSVHPLMKPLLSKESQIPQRRNCSEILVHNTKHVNSLKVINNLCGQTKTEPNIFEYQSLTSPLQHDKQRSYSPKLQNAIKLIEETKKSFSNKITPYERSNDGDKYNQNSKDKFKVGFSKMKQVYSPVSSYKESNIESLKDISTLIEFLKRSISTVESDAVREKRARTEHFSSVDKPGNAQKEVSGTEDALREEKSDPGPDIAFGLNAVNPKERKLRSDGSLAENTREPTENQMKIEMESQFITTENDTADERQDIRHVDSLTVTKCRKSRRETEPDIFQHLGKTHRYASLPFQKEEKNFSPRLEADLPLIQEFQEDQTTARDSISGDQDCNDGSGVRLSTMKQVNTLQDINVSSQREMTESERSKLLEEIKSLVHCLIQKIPATDSEKQNLGLMDESRQHNVQASEDKELDVGYKSETKSESATSSLETDREVTEPSEKKPIESEDRQELEMQNATKVIEETKRNFSNKTNPDERIYEGDKYDRSSKDKFKAGFSEMKQVYLPVSLHKESNIEALKDLNSLIEFLKKSISTVESDAVREKRARTEHFSSVDKPGDVQKEVSRTEDALREEKNDPGPDIAFGLNAVNSEERKLRSDRSLAENTGESTENQTKIEMEGQFIPTKSDTDRYSSLPSQKEHQLPEEFQEDQTAAPESISGDQGCNDGSGVRLPTTKQVNMSLDEKNSPEREMTESEQSKLLEGINSLTHCLEQKIPVSDSEKQNLLLMDESRQHNAQVSSQEKTLDVGYKSETKSEAAIASLEADCKVTEHPEKKPIESEDRQTLIVKSHSIPEKEHSECRFKHVDSQNILQVSKLHDQSESSGFQRNGDEWGSHPKKILNDLFPLEENRILSMDKEDTASEHISSGFIKEVASPVVNQLKSDDRFSEMEQTYAPVDKKLPEQYTEHPEEFARISLTSPELSNEEHNVEESKLKDTFQKGLRKGTLDDEGNKDSASKIPVKLQPTMESIDDTKLYYPEVAVEDDHKVNEKSLVVPEKVVPKPVAENQEDTPKDEPQFKSVFVSDVSANRESELDTNIFVPEKRPTEKEALEGWRHAWSCSSPMSTEEEDDEDNGLQSVSATTRIADSSLRTVYHFGPNKEFIEVFIDDDLKVRVSKDLEQDVYCNAMKHDDLPQGIDICASTVIAANDCVITTEISRSDKRETIVVYKNDEILFRSGNTVLH